MDIINQLTNNPTTKTLNMKWIPATERTPDHYKKEEVLNLKIDNGKGLLCPWTGTYDKDENAFYFEDLSPKGKKQFHLIYWLDESPELPQPSPVANVSADRVEITRLPNENDFQFELRKRKFEHVKDCDNPRCKEILQDYLSQSLPVCTDGEDVWEKAAMELFLAHNPNSSPHTEVGKRLLNGFINDMKILKLLFTIKSIK